jgi:hypothetical protein
MIGTEQSLSPALQEKLLTRSALRLGIDASTFDVVAENLRAFETLWFNAFLQQYELFGSDTDSLALYRAFREDRINALLDES